jgi:regulator of protease activity HflC (stomatin/prohibitin superfamily)
MKYYKGDPGTFLIGYKGGKSRHFGPGKSIWYMPFNTTLASVPILSQVAPFIFKEATANFQEASIQGQLTYRLTDPVKAAQFLNFTIDGKGNYRGKDLEKLTQRIVNTVQSYTRSGVNTMDLEDTLIKVKDLSGSVLEKIRAEPDLKALGVYVENLHFTSVSATPEMRKALEADYRESLQKRADQAIYDRRAAALEEERNLKQREMDTEVELENRRKDLVNMQAQNNLTLAEAEAKGDEMKLNPYGALSPQALVGLALKEWAGNAGTVENLSIGADVLSQLIAWIGGNNHVRPQA